MTSEMITPQNLPLVVLGGSDLDEMELLLGGLLSPADGYCLPSEVPNNWSAPFTLAISAEVAKTIRITGALLLADTDGTPLARVDVTGMETSATGAFVAGRLEAVRIAEHPPFRPLRLVSPLEDTAGNTVAAIFSEPPRSSEIALSIVKAQEQQGNLLLIATCGQQPHGNYTVTPLVDELLLCAAEVPNAQVGVLILPTGGLSLTSRAQVLQKAVLKNLGAGAVLDFTTVIGCVQPAESKTMCRRGTVIFLTGLSGSGKSTLARELAGALQRIEHRYVTLLDGDDTRRILSPTLGFSREAREENIRRLGWVAARISEAGGLVICAPIAPYAQTRSEVRAMAEAVGQYILVHVSTPLAVCEARDRKGLYAKARNGEIQNFTGVSAPYESPADADVRCDLGALSLNDAVATVLRAVVGQGGSTTQKWLGDQPAVVVQV